VDGVGLDDPVVHFCFCYLHAHGAPSRKPSPRPSPHDFLWRPCISGLKFKSFIYLVSFLYGIRVQLHSFLWIHSCSNTIYRNDYSPHLVCLFLAPLVKSAHWGFISLLYSVALVCAFC
jgi:hypothetical protein